MTQPDLFASRAPRVSDSDVAWLLRALDGRNWLTAKLLCQYGTNDRTLRAIAAASHGQIISGQKGYARTDQASVEDVNHFISWMRSQARQMTKRAAEAQEVLNGRFRGAA